MLLTEPGPALLIAMIGLTDHRKSATLRWSQPARPAQRIPLFVSLKPPQSAEGIAFLARSCRQFCEVRQGMRPCPADRSTGRDGDSAVPGSVLYRSPSTSVPLASAPLVLQPRSWANPPLAGDSWQLASPQSPRNGTLTAEFRWRPGRVATGRDRRMQSEQ